MDPWSKGVWGLRLRRIGIVVALGACVAQLGQVQSPAQATAGASWLDTLNAYRAASGVAPVVDEPAWSDGIVDHLQYLAYTPAELRTGAYASVHEENPASPYSTPQGVAGRPVGQPGHSSHPRSGHRPVDDVTVPCDRSAAPGPAHGAHSASWATEVGLDVLRGIEPAPLQQVLFPGDGSIVEVDSYSGQRDPDTARRLRRPVVPWPADRRAADRAAQCALDRHADDPRRSCAQRPGRTVRDHRSHVPHHRCRLRHSSASICCAARMRCSCSPRVHWRRAAYTVHARPTRRVPPITWRFGVGSFAHSALVSPDVPLRVRAGSPGSTVIGTLTVDGPLSAGFLTLYPCADGRPQASSLNFAAGQTIANTFVSAVDGDGFVCVYAMAPTHVIVDIVGETTMRWTASTHRCAWSIHATRGRRGRPSCRSCRAVAGACWVAGFDGDRDVDGGWAVECGVLDVVSVCGWSSAGEFVELRCGSDDCEHVRVGGGW